MNLAGLLLFLFVILPIAIGVIAFAVRMVMFITLLACPPLRRWAVAKADAAG